MLYSMAAVPTHPVKASEHRRVKVRFIPFSHLALLAHYFVGTEDSSGFSVCLRWNERVDCGVKGFVTA